MATLPIFVSLVVVVRNQALALESILQATGAALAACAADHELIVVDNASDDTSVGVLKRLTGENGLPNLQVYALTKEVDQDTAQWAGVENALGDFIGVFDAVCDDFAYLPHMLDQAVSGADVVFATNAQRPARPTLERACLWAVDALYRVFTGVKLTQEAPQYRVLNKKVINYLSLHPNPVVSYRHLRATAGFARVNLSYSAPPRMAWASQTPPGGSRLKRIGDGVDRGMQLVVSTTRGPMRLVTSLSLFGAVSNLLYSMYVIAIYFIKDDVAPGWVTLSLQQSGMFFLISLVLLVLGEYILNMASLSNEGPAYHVASELTSAIIERRARLNIEVGPSASALPVVEAQSAAQRAEHVAP